MARISPLTRDELGPFTEAFEAIEEASGYVPNSLLTMAHRPQLLAAFMPLASEVLMGDSSLSPGLRNLISNVTSRAAGCQYCIAHTAQSSAKAGIEADKIAAVFEYETNPLFTEAERAALNIAQSAASVPNMVSDKDFNRLRAYYTEEQIVEIMGIIALFGFLNRWNDSMATELEESPKVFAHNTLGASGWHPGKHEK